MDMIAEELTPHHDDLLVFIDDTGHETFAGAHGYYGLGGCIVPAFAYQAHLKARWEVVRQTINGRADAPLHASTITKQGKPEHFAALSEFFLDPSFVRLAVMTTRAVELPTGMHPCVAVLGELKQEISTVAALVPHNGVWVVLESSQRADPIIMNSFEQLTSMEGKPHKLEKVLMPKSSNEHGLEIADFIISAAGSQARRRLRQESEPAPDFRDVFGRLPTEGCRYREISNAQLHEGGWVSLTGTRFARSD